MRESKVFTRLREAQLRALIESHETTLEPFQAHEVDRELVNTLKDHDLADNDLWFALPQQVHTC